MTVRIDAKRTCTCCGERKHDVMEIVDRQGRYCPDCRDLIREQFLPALRIRSYCPTHFEVEPCREKCLAHGEHEPCPTCRSYIAAGL